MSRYTVEDAAALECRRMERVYSAMAPVYEAFFDWALGPGRRAAVGMLGIRAGESVLEVGVGTGLSLPLYPEGCRVVGVDIAEPMLEQARERAEALGRVDVELRRMDARDLSFPDESFDRVLAPYVVSVVPEPDRVMAEMCRVCRRGGSVVVVNHFRSRNRLLGFFERALTPASRWIGFRLDLPQEAVTEAPGLELVSVRAVNLLRLWRVVEMRRI